MPQRWGLFELDVFEYELNGTVAVVVVHLRVVGDVEKVSFKKFFLELSHSKTNASYRGGIVSNCDLQMVP